MRVAKKCLDLKAYNAGISRAYYAAFQRAEYHLRTSGYFRYQAYLAKIGADSHVPHGKMQLALAECLIMEKKTIKPQEINLYDDLYRKRRLADYTDQMLGETDLAACIKNLEIIMAAI
ncbi:hypothetical protein AGMMS49944_20780 [Spirochaetia bacterium]|nr:hypothetical protein AGMMS49944_20780 [Spirochaetia bacterium]